MLKFWRICLLFFCSKDLNVKRNCRISFLICEFPKDCIFLDKERYR